MKLTKTENGLILEMERHWEVSDVIEWIEYGFTTELDNSTIDNEHWVEFWTAIIKDMKVMTSSLDWSGLEDMEDE